MTPKIQREFLRVLKSSVECGCDPVTNAILGLDGHPPAITLPPFPKLTPAQAARALATAVSNVRKKHATNQNIEQKIIVSNNDFENWPGALAETEVDASRFRQTRTSHGVHALADTEQNARTIIAAHDNKASRNAEQINSPLSGEVLHHNGRTLTPLADNEQDAKTIITTRQHST